VPATKLPKGSSNEYKVNVKPVSSLLGNQDGNLIESNIVSGTKQLPPMNHGQKAVTGMKA